MSPASGRLLAGRYQLTGRPDGPGVPGRALALDAHTGIRVALEAVPLPEVVSAEILDDDGLGTVYGPPAEDGPGQRSGPVTRALRHAAEVAEQVPGHPRLLQVFQVFEEDGCLWVAGEHLPGVPLARLLERGPLPAYRVAEILDDVLAALQAVHSAGLVHGNITPETVLVCEDGAAMLGGLSTGAAQEALCDGPDAEVPGAAVTTAVPWGLARCRARDGRAALTGPCAERWAPEQVGPAQGPWYDSAPPGEPVGPAADGWAVGVLLFRALTGRAPFPEESTADLFAAVRAGGHASAKSCGPLRPLVEELLAHDPAARPESKTVRGRLAGLLAHAPEPYDPDVLSAAELLPAVRPRGTVEKRRRGAVEKRRGGPVEPHPAHPHGPSRHARRGGIRPGLLGPLLVGGVLLTVLLVLVVTALLAR